MSNFEVKAQRKERLLCKSVIAYIGAAADFTGTFYVHPCTGSLTNCEQPSRT